jgi:TolB protein
MAHRRTALSSHTRINIQPVAPKTITPVGVLASRIHWPRMVLNNDAYARPRMTAIISTPTQPRQPPSPTARTAVHLTRCYGSVACCARKTVVSIRIMRLVRWLLLPLLLAAYIGTAGAQAPDSLPGRLLFVKEGDLWVWDGSGAHQLATGGTFSQPSWAPDGISLAYVYRGNNFADIFVTDDQGQSQRRLTTSQSTVLDNNDWNFRPTWSPDGKLLAFVSDRTSTFPTLWVMNAADGTGLHVLATPGLQEEAVDALSWSPDGTQLAVTLFNEPGPTQIALVPLSATGRQTGRLLTSLPGGAIDPAFSPDGGWVAFAGRDGYVIDIYAIHPDGTSLTRLTNDGQLLRSPVWSPDGRHVAYLSNKTGFFEVWVVDLQFDASGTLSASAPRQLTQDLLLDAASGLSWGR